MFIMIDNYDSFVYNLVRYLQELDEQVLIFRNDKITIHEIEALKPEGIIISPGPKNPEKAGISLDILRYFKGRVPILGICLGHQTIAHYFGCKIVKGAEPVHGKVHELFHNDTGVYKGLPSPIKVTRYHSLAADKYTLPSCLTVTAEARDGTIMGIRHVEYPIEGVQFHPEAELTEHGHQMLKNFIAEARNFNKRNGEK
ncbi:MAG: aminodeoxychorismate/anthranilate synthase component II [Bacillota bacterium]|nr:aminodeoxychorismate/anthranilate synthase component II [Bacillota bacterium]